MEGSRETEDVEIFVKTFSNLSQRGRKLAIHKLVSTLDSDEMDMVIEAIDSKIDNVALQQSEDRQSMIENESLEDSGVSSISPSETNFDQVHANRKNKNFGNRHNAPHSGLFRSSLEVSKCSIYPKYLTGLVTHGHTKRHQFTYINRDRDMFSKIAIILCFFRKKKKKTWILLCFIPA